MFDQHIDLYITTLREIYMIISGTIDTRDSPIEALEAQWKTRAAIFRYRRLSAMSSMKYLWFKIDDKFCEMPKYRKKYEIFSFFFL